MPTKLIPLAVALVFGTVAAVGFSKMMKAQPQVATVEIYVASRVINQSEEFTQDAIKLERWPSAVAPKDAVTDWEKLKGRFAGQRLLEGEPIVNRKLLSKKETQSGGIPKGYTVVALRADSENSVGNLLAPGDRVDIIGFFSKNDIFPETTTKTVLSGVRVWAVNGKTTRDALAKDESKQSGPRTISLLIHKGDAEPWMLVSELGKVRLSLGRPDDGVVQENSEEPNPAGQAFLTWLADYQEVRNRPAPPQSPQTTETSPAETEPAPPVQPIERKPTVVHEMVRRGADGTLTVYRWEEGSSIPTITTIDGGLSQNAGLDTVPRADGGQIRSDHQFPSDATTTEDMEDGFGIFNRRKQSTHHR